MASERYDVVVIGAGPAGYIAAIRAAQLGMKVACAEKWTNPKGEMALGGTCLNVGCIPSKALLASSEKYEEAAHHLGEHGIEIGGAKIDLAKMQARKDGIVTKMTKGIEFLFRKNKIAWLKGHARFTGMGDGMVGLEVLAAGGPQLIEARRRTGRPQVDVSFPEVEKFDHLPPARVEGPTAFVSIMEGCSKYCSFCVVPYTRGEEISRQVVGVGALRPTEARTFTLAVEVATPGGR